VVAYPPVGETIQGMTANTGVYIYYRMGGRFTKVSASLWEAETFSRLGLDGNQSNLNFYNPVTFQTFTLTTAAGINNYNTLQMFGGDIAFGGGTHQKLNNTTNHLVLSNSLGSTVTVSGALKVTGEIDSYRAKVVRYTGATYTFSASDSGRIVELSATTGSPINLYLPNNLPQGFNCTVVQFASASLVHYSASVGSVLRCFNQLSKSAGWYAESSIYVSENTTGVSASYVLGGNLV
jgi:hypothetical protein